MSAQHTLAPCFRLSQVYRQNGFSAPRIVAYARGEPSPKPLPCPSLVRCGRGDGARYNYKAIRMELCIACTQCRSTMLTVATSTMTSKVIKRKGRAPLLRPFSSNKARKTISFLSTLFKYWNTVLTVKHRRRNISSPFACYLPLMTGNQTKTAATRCEKTKKQRQKSSFHDHIDNVIKIRINDVLTYVYPVTSSRIGHTPYRSRPARKGQTT